MVKAVHSPADLFVGWSILKDCDFWVFIGKTHKLYFGSQLYRFVVFNAESRQVRSELLSFDGVNRYVLS